jgi:predicted enzyme related to lactoylglutathione lyase
MPVFTPAAAAGPLPTAQKANTAAARDREPGGEADQPGPVPGMGWFVTCPDPQGNKSGLWQTDPSAPAPAG